MNVPFSALFILNVVIITVSETGAWRWGDNKSKNKHWNWGRGRTDTVCSSGECVQAWKCPEGCVLRQSTGSCFHWTNGPWVCCDLTHGGNRGAAQTTPPTPPTVGYTKRAATGSWKNGHSTEGHTRRISSTPSPWNRNPREKPIPVSSIGDILRNGPVTWRPASTKVPLTGVRKTMEDPFRRYTTPPPSKITPKRTPLDPRIVFPTAGMSWTKKTTRHPVYGPTTPKKVTTQGHNSPWYRPTTPTKVTTQGHKLTTSPWYRSTTTARGRQTTKAWVIGSGGGRKSTTPYPTRPRATSARTTGRPIYPRTTVNRTRRDKTTTPVPNVNIDMCGIREKEPASSRRVRSSNFGYNLPSDVVHIGPVNMKHRQTHERIVGGEEVEPFSWPWVAALYKVTSTGGHRFLSAGSLINGHFVLTAAHVFAPSDLGTATYVVMLGTHDAQDAVAEYEVKSVVQHPDYENRYYYHDIALLELSRPVLFNDYVMPVCLPSPGAPLLRDRDLEGKHVTVMGWGDESFGGKSSRVLKEATFSIVSRASCNASYVRVDSNRFPRGITPEMLCAGDPNGGKDACQGDSGGPLTSMVQGRYTQVGIVSFGYQCGDKEFPGVYTKVAPYLSWIAENTRRIEDEHDHDYHYDYDYRK